jgi:hypothetical protein
MILTKDRASTVPYLIPSGVVPSAIAWTLYDMTNTALASDQPVTPPTSYTVASGAAGDGADEVVLTLGVAPAEFAVGDVVRVRDTWGRDFDGVVFGVNTSAKQLRVADCPIDASEVATCWNPLISIPVSASYVDEVGDGWRVKLAITQSGTVVYDNVYFAVALLSLNLTVSPREYLDHHPESANDLAHMETRKDWSRLIAVARGRVEERLRGEKRWYSLVVSSTGVRRAVIEALHMLMAPSWAPESVDRMEWKREAVAGFNESIAALLASGSYDADASGVVDDDEDAPGQTTSYQVK